MKRNSNIEMLRIISMLLIITLHMTQCDKRFNSLLSNGPITFNTYSIIVLKLLANIGVSLFALITGFYGVKFSSKKLFYIIHKTWFYSLLIAFVFLILGDINIINLAHYFIPLNSGHWYITAYVFLLLLMPLIKNNIDNMYQNHLKRWLMITGILLYAFRWLGLDIGTNIILLIFLYCLGRYIAKLDIEKLKRIKYAFLSLSIFSLLVISLLITILHSELLLKLFGSNFSPLTLCFSTSIFIFFISKKYYTNFIINKLATAALSSYIISETLPMKHYLLYILNKYNYNVVTIVCFSICIYIVCFIIDIILSPLETKLSIGIYNKFKNILKSNKYE